MAKAACLTATDVEARKRGEQTGLDTLVVLSLRHISDPTIQEASSYAVFGLKKEIHRNATASVPSMVLSFSM